MRTKVVRRALEQLNAALRAHRGMQKNPMSTNLQTAVRGAWDKGRGMLLDAAAAGWRRVLCSHCC